MLIFDSRVNSNIKSKSNPFYIKYLSNTISRDISEKYKD